MEVTEVNQTLVARTLQNPIQYNYVECFSWPFCQT